MYASTPPAPLIFALQRLWPQIVDAACARLANYSDAPPPLPLGFNPPPEVDLRGGATT